MLLVCISSYLKSVLRYKLLSLDTRHPVPITWASVWGSVVIFRRRNGTAKLLYSINWSVFVTEQECLLRGADWVFKCDSSQFPSFSMATCYGLDDPRIESRWVQDFPHPSRPVLRPTQPPIQCVPGRCVNHPSPSGAEVKESVELYLYSPFCLLLHCICVSFIVFVSEWICGILV
jgi:hypothetical protein